jgi:hypothetical protein
MKISNWRVTTYDKDEEVLETFVVENRTEREAEKEAMNDVDVFDCWDWTMVEIDDEPRKN